MKTTKDYTQWALPAGAKSRLGKGQINDVKYSPDERLLVVASSVGIWLYDTDTGEEVDLLVGHTGSVNALAFSPDGRTFASGSRDSTICLWGIITNRLLSILRGHTASVDTLAFSPDGSILASGSRVWQDKVRLWDVNNGREHTIPLGYWSSASTLTFSPNGKRLAIGEGNGGIHLYNAYTGAALSTYFGTHTSAVNALSYSPNGKTLASGSADSTIWLCDAETGQRYKTLTKHNSSVTSLAFSPDGKILASASWDGTLRLWDASVGRELGTLTGHKGWINALAYSRDGRTLVSGGNDGTLRLWSATTGHELFTVTGHTSEAIGPMEFSPDGKTLASESLLPDETIKLLNVNTGQEYSISSEHPVRTKGLAFSPDGKILAGGSYQKIYLWNAETGVHLSTLGRQINSGKARKFTSKILNIPPGEGHTDWIRTLTFSPNGCFLATGSEDKTVRLWNLSKGHEVSFPGRHVDWVNALSFSSDSRLLASGSEDGQIKLWDAWNVFTRVANSEVLKISMDSEVSIIGRHENGISALGFSSDNCLLASGGQNGTIQLWNVPSNLMFSTLVGHTGQIYALAFLCNDRILASGGGDNTIRLWNTSTGQELAVITGHTAPVRTLVFLSDSRILASGGNDGTIFLWDWDRIVPDGKK